MRLVVEAWQELRTELVDADAARSFCFLFIFFLYYFFIRTFIFVLYKSLCTTVLSTYISMYL